jgi:hypothetical protein
MDSITIEILGDGSIKTTTNGSIGAANHSLAENFLKDIALKAGGTVEITKNKNAHHHHHDGEHEHDHDHT